LKVLSIDRGREARIIGQLNEVPLFRELGDHERGEILKCSELVEFSRDEVIVRQGEVSPEFFVLLSGEAGVIVSSCRQGEFYDVGSVSQGEMIGEISALLKEPRTASVMATDTCQLLRFRDENFLDLFEKIPSFGFFLSREMARRLLDVMGSRNELIAESSPETVTIDPTDLSRMRSFMTGYYTSAIKSAMKKNQLITRKQFPRYRAGFSFSAEEQKKWFELFDVKESECPVPFTYASISLKMMLMKAAGDMEINFKNLKHIKSEMIFNAEGRVPECEKKYAVQSELTDMIALRENRAVLMMKTFVYNQEMFLMSTHKDYFIVPDIDPAYLEALASVKEFGRQDPDEFRNIDMQQSRLAITHQHDVIYHKKIDIPADMGHRYGKISGDLNMAHAASFAAKLFGNSRPFLQELCTANYVLKNLMNVSIGHLMRFTILFVKPVLIDQTVNLYISDRDFEVVAEDNQLLAKGAWESA